MQLHEHDRHARPRRGRDVVRVAGARRHPGARQPEDGGSQGNPNYTYYKLAAAEYGASGSPSCNSDLGAPASPSLPASSCIFNDVTAGDIDLPCTGTDNCYGYSKSGQDDQSYGALSTSSSAFSSAYPAGTGWDYATGLGTVNAYNLVTNW